MSKKIQETTTALVTVNPENATKLFTGDAMDILIDKLEKDLGALVPDTTTSKGRKAIASTAYKVSQSKVLIDDLGKNLVAKWKDKTKNLLQDLLKMEGNKNV